MMSEFRMFMFILVIAVAGLISVSGAADSVKFVCPGETVQAFQNITFDRCNAIVSLNINGPRNIRIATWSMHNCTLNETLLPDYQKRLLFDQTGSIWIRNFHHFDQGKYVVLSQMDTMPDIYEVEISIMVAPSKNCKPKIMRLETSLLATLDPNDCGKPVTTLFWKDNDGVSNTSKEKLKLTPGKEAGTYYACIEGPALHCVRNLTPQDYCSSITIQGSNSPPIPSEACNTTVLTVLIAISIVFGLLLVLVTTVLIIRERRRKRVPATNITFENIKTEQSTPLMELPQLWKKHFDKLSWKDVIQYLNGDQQQGLKTYYVSEHMTQDASTEHPTSTGPEKGIELVQQDENGICKICCVNSSSMSFLPCGHIATCANCSTSPQVCPVCRKQIKAVVRPYSN
ncbi:hypothetical protein CHS0354_025613 [Potamilus streckersoni]|uniref:RING-type domain-containing protein n=1 Tax=Potamilus streckersoni TaxID=2493646 RepID=A0AAE0S1A9_9BIVA|nr:hypothetical protein CHS0354_025613 [Potamilus streckersoni]